MNCTAQELSESKVRRGWETLPATPKVLLVFVSHAAPSTINTSLSAISHLLEDNTSLSTSCHKGEKATEERELPGTGVAAPQAPPLAQSP